MLNLDKGIVVLSLFDGMACGRIALERAGIKVKAYYASEIDKPAMKVAKHNWPDIIHIGDVTKVFYCEGWLFTENGEFYVGKIDLLIGGSPCQGFSFAGKQLNFNDPRSKLFFEFVRLREETQCEYFFLENVVMKKEYQEIISSYLNVQPVFINSALVSAQTRKRLYWSNIPFYKLPVDKGIYLKDILLDKVDEKYIHSAEAVAYMCREVSGGRSHWEFKHHSDSDKSSCITAVISKGVPYNVLIDRLMSKGLETYQINQSKKANGKQPHNQDRIYDSNGKCVALSTEFAGRTNVLHVREATKKGFIEVQPGECFDNTFPESKTRRGRAMVDKANCLTATKYDYNQYLGNAIIRRLTPIECERLQTVKDGYTSVSSDTQAYRMLGNGWTVDVIAHLFEPLKYVI